MPRPNARLPADESYPSESAGVADPERHGLTGRGTVNEIDPVGPTAIFSPTPRIAPPPFGSASAGSESLVDVAAVAPDASDHDRDEASSGVRASVAILPSPLTEGARASQISRVKSAVRSAFDHRRSRLGRLWRIPRPHARFRSDHSKARAANAAPDSRCRAREVQVESLRCSWNSRREGRRISWLGPSALAQQCVTSSQVSTDREVNPPDAHDGTGGVTQEVRARMRP
jgi:hypothetical protein